MSDNLVEQRLLNLPEPDLDDPDNPEWTEEMFIRARAEVHLLPPEIAALIGRKLGRPVGTIRSDRKQVTLRMPQSVIDHFKAGGPGWQTRVVGVLEREAKLGK